MQQYLRQSANFAGIRAAACTADHIAPYARHRLLLTTCDSSLHIAANKLLQLLVGFWYWVGEYEGLDDFDFSQRFLLLVSSNLPQATNNKKGNF